MKEDLTTIRITKETKAKIENLAAALDRKQITVLEYLLSGKISLESLNNN